MAVVSSKAYEGEVLSPGRKLHHIAPELPDQSRRPVKKMVEESVSVRLLKIEKAEGPFIEKRTYKCSCGVETTEIIRHLLKDHHLSIRDASKVVARVKQPTGAWT